MIAKAWKGKVQKYMNGVFSWHLPHPLPPVQPILASAGHSSPLNILVGRWWWRNSRWWWWWQLWWWQWEWWSWLSCKLHTMYSTSGRHRCFACSDSQKEYWCRSLHWTSWSLDILLTCHQGAKSPKSLQEIIICYHSADIGLNDPIVTFSQGGPSGGDYHPIWYW